MKTRHCTRCLCAIAWRWTSRRGAPSSRRSEVTSSDVHLRRTSGVHDVPRRVLALEADDVALVVLDEVVRDTTNMIFGVRR